jgi:hypothetical protein
MHSLDPTYALCGVYSGTERPDEGGPLYEQGEAAFEAHHWQEAARLFLEAAKHYTDASDQNVWRENRWISYSAATLSLLNASEVEQARQMLLDASKTDGTLADPLRRAAAALPNPPSCSPAPKSESKTESSR